MKRILSLACALVLASISGHAQSQVAEPVEKSKEPAHLKVWAMVFEERGPLVVKFKQGESDPMVLLDDPGDKPSRGSYVEVPNGTGEITVLSGGVPLPPVKINLVPNDFQTLLVFRKNGKLNMEVFQDPLPGQKDFPPVVRLLNFGTGRNAEVTIAGGRKTVVPENSCVIVPVAGAGELNLGVSLPDPTGGPPATSVTDINISSKPSWSVVMIPDYRGKLRPRVSPDGRE